MVGKMQISFKERAGCMLVFIDDTLHQRGGDKNGAILNR